MKRREAGIPTSGQSPSELPALVPEGGTAKASRQERRLAAQAAPETRAQSVLCRTGARSGPHRLRGECGNLLHKRRCLLTAFCACDIIMPIRQLKRLTSSLLDSFHPVSSYLCPNWMFSDNKYLPHNVNKSADEVVHNERQADPSTLASQRCRTSLASVIRAC